MAEISPLNVVTYSFGIFRFAVFLLASYLSFLLILTDSAMKMAGVTFKFYGSLIFPKAHHRGHHPKKQKLPKP